MLDPILDPNAIAQDETGAHRPSRSLITELSADQKMLASKSAMAQSMSPLAA
jgi:hypothetical protein